MLRKFSTLFFALFLISLNAQNSITGFSEEKVDAQLQLEKSFEEKLTATNLDQWMQRMAAEPHWVGTQYGAENAKWMQSLFKSWGYDAKIETYQILFPYPTERVLELTGPTSYTAKLTAVPVEGDPFTAQGDALLPSYNAFSTDGDVEAELVFVNYGIPKDYEELEKLGISVEGKIVIAKYQDLGGELSQSWRLKKERLGVLSIPIPKTTDTDKVMYTPKGPSKIKRVCNEVP